MAKVKKMAGGGLSSLGSLLGITTPAGAPASPFQAGSTDPAAAGSSAQDGLSQVQNGAASIQQSLGTASDALNTATGAIGTTGDIAPTQFRDYVYKKGGAVKRNTKSENVSFSLSKVSTAKKNSKQPKW